MRAYDHAGVRIYQGDVRDCLQELEAESVQCVVTSPPYWGLRDYGIEPSIWGGREDCEHEWEDSIILDVGRNDGGRDIGGRGGNYQGNGPHKASAPSGAFCYLCGAWRGCLGLEPTPQLFVEHMVEVFREVKRVLREDGTLWLNLGDSYGRGDRTQWEGDANRGANSKQGKVISSGGYATSAAVLPAKNLIGIPWRVAFALQADGWYLRSDIIWHKPNPMPESVTDRPTKAHEYLFLLTKSPTYFYDAEAIREECIDGYRINPNHIPRTGRNAKSSGIWRGAGDGKESVERGSDWSDTSYDPNYRRNRRSVWTIATEAFPSAHFATFPTGLVEPCVLAGTPEAGCCSKCGKPWERVVEKSKSYESGWAKAGNPGGHGKNGTQCQGGGSTVDIRMGPTIRSQTLGFRPACKCDAPSRPSIVLDPFAGSGTTLMVAKNLGRHAVGCELSTTYVEMSIRRLQQDVLPLEVS